MNDKIEVKAASAIKWSTITEIIAKLIAPITSMILARLFTPNAFGIVASITMITSFAEVFQDAGFQKYIIQHEFIDEDHKEDSLNVAFWTNLISSFLIWFFIGIFSQQISILVGNPGLGFVITIACISLPLTGFSSIQMALYRRNFDYKTLFTVRLVGSCLPFIVTIPLAIIFHSYWALVIGTLLGKVANAVILTLKSTWKPKMIYKFSILKEMISFSIWSLIEQISIWLTAYADTFIVATSLSTYYLGIYKTSMTTVNQIMTLVVGSTSTVLFSSLSRLQQNNSEFESMFFKFQRLTSVLILPMGVGIFLYSDLITDILLGSRWAEASGFIGIFGLMAAITIVLSNYNSEFYRAKGSPKLSFLL